MGRDILSRTAPRGEAGFTLVELLVAVAMFAMVMAGLAVIYSSAYKQGIGLLNETRLRNMSTLTARAVQKELAQATRITVPTPNTSGLHLRGWTNTSPDDSAGAGSAPVRENMSGSNADTHWFHFCVQTDAVNGCGAAGEPPGCLFYYHSGPTNYFAVHGITDATCGEVQNGVTPEIIAAAITGTVPGTGPGGTDYFTRVTDANSRVREQNQVRLNFRMMRPVTPRYPTLVRVDTDTSFSAQLPSVVPP